MTPTPDDILRMFTASWGAGRGDANFADDMLKTLLGFYLIGTNSAYRYWSEWGEVYWRYYSKLSRYLSAMNSDPSKCEEAKQELLNSLSACIREMSELSNREARRFQAELAEVLAQMWPGDGQEEAGQYWRRWNVKP
jgi:hypothetical protein